MKAIAFFVFVGCLINSVSAFTQTSKSIEADLFKSFKQIDDWSADTGSNASESLWRAKKTVGEKLFFYTSKFPCTISYPFNLLKTEHVNINTSDDGLFRIYSWDTWTGGTMHFFESVFQYKVGNKTISVLDTEKKEGDSRPKYRKLYTVEAGSKNYYIAVYLFIESSMYYGEGVQCFSISDRKLIDDEKIIKTTTGIHSQIEYEANLGSDLYWKVRPSIHFDKKTNILYIPLVKPEGKVTHKYITYKFTGKYFEKVKT